MRTRSYVLASLFAGLPLLVSGCATLIHSDHQSVRIFSTPGEASVVVDGRIHLITAGTISLSRFADHAVVVEKDGYEPVTMMIERHMSGLVWLNIWCLPAIYWCWKSDREDGGYWAFDNDIHVELTRRADASAPPQPQTP